MGRIVVLKGLFRLREQFQDVRKPSCPVLADRLRQERFRLQVPAADFPGGVKGVLCEDPRLVVFFPDDRKFGGDQLRGNGPGILRGGVEDFECDVEQALGLLQ